MHIVDCFVDNFIIFTIGGEYCRIGEFMKKIFLRITISICILAVSIAFVGCKKKDDLDKIGANLSNYYIDLEYNNSTKSAVSNCEIDYCNPTEALLKEVKLHLYIASFTRLAKNKVVDDTNFASCFYNGESFATLNIARVLLNGEDISPTYEGEDNDIMVIELKSSLYPSERVNIKIEYSFSLPNCNHRFGYGDNTISFGNFYPVACVYEDGWKTDGYFSTGDPFFSDMSNYFVSLKTEDNLTLASTGYVKNSTTESGAKYYNIEAKCVRDFAFVLSEKFQKKSAEWKGVEINYYYFNDTNADKTLACGVDSIRTFSELFYRYPYKTYNIVEADFCYGGMEYPNLSIISSSVDNDKEYLNVVVHETAHQWWYNLVGNDEYNESWLDESLTEFSCMLFYDNNKGYDYNHQDMINSAHQNYLLYKNTYENVLGKLDTSMNRPINKFNTEPEYTFTIYCKGVLMYDSLYQLVGEKKFVKSLSLYAHNNAYKIAHADDLVSAFETATNSNLEDFFDCWLTGKVIIE